MNDWDPDYNIIQTSRTGKKLNYIITISDKVADVDVRQLIQVVKSALLTQDYATIVSDLTYMYMHIYTQKTGYLSLYLLVKWNQSVIS